MGLDFAIDQLFGTGWSALDTSGCEYHGGRCYPGLGRVLREFSAANADLSLRKVDLFDCYRAEWRDASGRALGGIVGSTELEAAVYALAMFRRAAQTVTA
ncbi:MAG: hypothetical protein ACKVZJ_01240 [Phycisphaerales bacterium]